MHSPLPLTRDLVLIGGGHTHALVLRRWGMVPLPGARLTLINPGPTAAYTGMLPGHVAGHYTRDELDIDLVRLARFAGARLILGAADGIDRAAKTVSVPGRPPVRYDILSIDIGITSDAPQIPGFLDHGVAAKPLDRFADHWASFCAEVARGERPPEVAVIGGGVGGVELALAMQHRLAGLGSAPQVAVADAGRALSDVAPRTRVTLLRRLARAGVALYEHDPAAEIGADELRLASGRAVPAALTVSVAGARAHRWLSRIGLAHRNGFLTVDPQLRSVSDPAIYAVGDCAHLGFAPRPKAGVYAVRAAPTLFHNLRADLAGGARRRFGPQSGYLKLVSFGAKRAVADRSGFSIAGPWVWSWKDRIDRAFMDKLTSLPAMRPPPLPFPRAKGAGAARGSQPLCAGCGAKMGGTALATALARLPAPERHDVASRPGDDAAILRHGDGWQVLTTDHLRAFTEDPALFARIAAVHALGDIWAMGAAPQAATATVILPRMAPPLAEATLAELLHPAAEVFRAEGAELVGGHTTFGDELTLGLSITGLRDTAPIALEGAVPGDALILTKPIGSGTILAGEMQLRAAGRDVAACHAAMAAPQGGLARLMTRHAHAMTDVTGFGLAGHLMNICLASAVGARLSVEAIPVFPGAEALAAAGVHSTLSPDNRAAVADLIHGVGDTPRERLLFDPQTSGGLLAAVPGAEADALLAALQEAGATAARIGSLVDAPPGITLA